MRNIDVAERLFSKFAGRYTKSGRTVIYIAKSGEKFVVRFSEKSVNLRELSEYSVDGCIFMLCGDRIGKVYFKDMKKKIVGVKDTVPFDEFEL